MLVDTAAKDFETKYKVKQGPKEKKAGKIQKKKYRTKRFMEWIKSKYPAIAYRSTATGSFVLQLRPRA